MICNGTYVSKVFEGNEETVRRADRRESEHLLYNHKTTQVDLYPCNITRLPHWKVIGAYYGNLANEFHSYSQYCGFSEQTESLFDCMQLW